VSLKKIIANIEGWGCFYRIYPVSLMGNCFYLPSPPSRFGFAPHICLQPCYYMLLDTTN